MRVVALAADMACVPVEALLHSREPSPSRWRWAVSAVFRRAGYSLPAIAQVLGCDHTTVLTAVRRVEVAPLREIVDRLDTVAHVPRMSADPHKALYGLAAADTVAALREATEASAARRGFVEAIALLDRAVSTVALWADAAEKVDPVDAATLRRRADGLMALARDVAEWAET